MVKMEKTVLLPSLNKGLWRPWGTAAAIATMVAVALVGIEAMSSVPGMRRTFTMIIMPYAIVAAGISAPLLYFASHYLRSRWGLPVYLTAIFLLAGVLLSSAAVGLLYFEWVLPAPPAPFPIWKLLSKELLGISLPFWIVILSLWLWHTRRQVAIMKQDHSPIKPEEKPVAAEYLTVTHGQDQYLLKPEEVQFIRAEGNYCKLFAKDRFYLKKTTLKNLEQMPYSLVRIHRSALVNPAFVSSVRSAGHGDLKVNLRSGQELKCSRNYAKALKASLAL